MSAYCSIITCKLSAKVRNYLALMEAHLVEEVAFILPVKEVVNDVSCYNRVEAIADQLVVVLSRLNQIPKLLVAEGDITQVGRRVDKLLGFAEIINAAIEITGLIGGDAGFPCCTRTCNLRLVLAVGGAIVGERTCAQEGRGQQFD